MPDRPDTRTPAPDHRGSSIGPGAPSHYRSFAHAHQAKLYERLRSGVPIVVAASDAACADEEEEKLEDARERSGHVRHSGRTQHFTDDLVFLGGDQSRGQKLLSRPAAGVEL